MRKPTGSSLRERLRTRGDRVLRSLDAQGWIGDPPRPMALAVAIAALVALLGLTTFAIGRSGSGTPFLLGAAIGVFGIAVAVGGALVASQYQTMGQLDEARAELIAIHAELEAMRRDVAASYHDAKAITAAMGAAVHALQKDGDNGEIATALTTQLDTLRRLMAPRSSDLEVLHLRSLVAPIEAFAALHQLEVTCDLPAEARVLAHPAKATQILQNLIDNARKYAPGSPITVRHTSAGPSHRIIVEDDGPGLEGDEESAFLPGVRVESAAQGFGMGLAVARSLAEGMHGALWYERRPGGGSRFVLKLMGADDRAFEGSS